MKHVEPSVSIIQQEPGLVGALKMIEKAGRICYASTAKENSYETFFERCKSTGHGRPLEFGTVYLTIPFFNCTYLIRDKFLGSPYCRITHDDRFVYVTTNMRFLLQGSSPDWDTAIRDKYKDSYLEELSPYIDNSPTEHHVKRVTILWDVIARGIADEFRTHTTISSLMESTRYCLYSSKKFDGQIKYAVTEWFRNQENNEYKEEYLAELANDEAKYIHFVNDLGMKAEQARFKLGFNYATKFIQCAFTDTWNDFFSQRVTPHAHEDARYIANMAVKEWDKAIEEGMGIPELIINYNRQ